jgi:hypothetical protein
MALAVQAAASGCETDDGAPPDGNVPLCPNRGPGGCAEGYRLSGKTSACVPGGDAAAGATTDGNTPEDQAAGDVVSAEEAEFQALTVGLGGAAAVSSHTAQAVCGTLAPLGVRICIR